MQELGVDTTKATKSVEEEKNIEPKIEDVPTTQTFNKAITHIEKEKEQARTSIPEKYRTQGTASTALSLVNALANNQNAIALR